MTLPEKSRYSSNEKISNGDGLHWWQKRRYFVCVLSFFGYMLSYCMRSNLSIAIVAMTTPVLDKNGTILKEADFDWDSVLQGYLLSSFFYGYLTTQLLGGWLAARFGGHIIMAITIAVPSILNLCIPISTHFGFVGVLVIRTLMGVFSGPCISTNQAIWSKWAPPEEKNSLLTCSYTGIHVGIILSMSAGGIIIQNLGWQYLFYISGAVGLFWALIWLIFVRNCPENVRNINKKELEFIKIQLNETKQETIQLKNVPWKRILTSSPVWAHFMLLNCYAWGFNTILTQMPRYFSDILGFDMATLGYLSSIPYMGHALVLPLAGLMSDWLINKKKISRTTVCKVFTAIGCLGQAFFILLQLVVYSKEGIVTLLTMAFSLESIINFILLSNTLDLSRKYASIIWGLNNTFGSIASILSPIVAGYLTQDKTKEGWMFVFSIISGLSIMATIVFSFFGSAERQPWAD